MQLFIARGRMAKVVGEPVHFHAEVVTVVLRHATGQVGFERADGPTVLKRFVEHSYAVELTNTPMWQEADDRFVLQRSGKGVAVIANPSDHVIGELNALRKNELTRKKNAILVRHGKAPESLRETRFDEWVLGEKRLRVEEVEWLLHQSDGFSIWSRSDFGLFARSVSLQIDPWIEQINRIASELGIEAVRVPNEAALPVW